MSSSVIPFSSCPQSFPASGSFQMSQLSESGGQSIGDSASTSVPPINIQDWFPLRRTGWISLQSKGLSGVFSNTTVQNLLKFMSIESMMLSNHLIIYHPLFLLPSIFPSIRVFSSESTHCLWWPEYWSFSFNISPSVNSQCWYPLGLTGLISLWSKGLSRIFSKTTIQKHPFFGAHPLWSSSHLYMTTGKTIALTMWIFVGKVMPLLFSMLYAA